MMSSFPCFVLILLQLATVATQAKVLKTTDKGYSFQLWERLDDANVLFTFAPLLL